MIDDIIRILTTELFEVSVNEDIFYLAKEAEKSFEVDFKASYDALNDLYVKIKNDEGFRSEACEEFIALFDIMIQYQKDLIKEMPDLFKAFDSFSQSLEEIEKLSIYKELS